MSYRVYLGIGSNVEPERNIQLALTDLREQFDTLLISPIYRNEAVGFNGDDFLNLVAGIHTSLPPLELRKIMRSIEKARGRLRQGSRFSAKALDIDILTYGHQVLQEDGLTIPRDDITRHAFVLKPLADIAANDHHPVLRRTYGELWAEFSGVTPMDRIRLHLSLASY